MTGLQSWVYIPGGYIGWSFGMLELPDIFTNNLQLNKLIFKKVKKKKKKKNVYVSRGDFRAWVITLHFAAYFLSYCWSLVS